MAQETRAAYSSAPRDSDPSATARTDVLAVGEGADEILCVTPATIEAAERATTPFRLPAHGPEADRDTQLLAAMTRLLEGVRLMGRPPDLSPHPMAHAVGPLMTTHTVVRATRTTRQNLAAQAKKRRLIRLASSERTQWWPTFQFRRAGDRVLAHPGVQALWGALPQDTVTDWDHAVWLCTPRHDLDGDAPIDLATGPEAVDRPPLRDVIASYRDRLTR